MPRDGSTSDVYYERTSKGRPEVSSSGSRVSRGSSTFNAKTKASSTPPFRTGTISHPPLPPARKKGRAKEQGNPLALGPPIGKKTKFLSLAAEGPARSTTSSVDSRLVDLRLGSHSSNADDDDSLDPRPGVVAVTRPTPVVPKEPLSKRRARAEATQSMPVILPVRPAKVARRQTTFDSAFSLRKDGTDEQSPALKPPKPSAKKPRSSDDLPMAAIASLLAEQAGSSTSTRPVEPTAVHPNAHKTRLNDSQRARAKHIRDGWIKVEGISAKAANSRWVDILSAAGWNGDVALLVAKHFAAAGGGVQTSRDDRRTDDDEDGLHSFHFSPVVSVQSDADGQSSASAPASPATASAGTLPAESRKRRRRRSSSDSSVGRPVFYNPFLALSQESPPVVLTPDDRGPETSVLPAVATSSAVEASSTSEPASTSSLALPDLPADDRSISTTAIRTLQRLTGSKLAPEFLLDLVDLFHADGQAAEVFLSLRDDALKTLWIQRQAKKLALA